MTDAENGIECEKTWSEGKRAGLENYLMCELMNWKDDIRKEFMSIILFYSLQSKKYSTWLAMKKSSCGTHSTWLFDFLGFF